MKKLALITTMIFTTSLTFASTPIELNLKLREFHRSYMARDMKRVGELRPGLFRVFIALQEKVNSNELELTSIEQGDFNLAQNYYNSMKSENNFSKIATRYTAKKNQNLSTRPDLTVPQNDEDTLTLAPPIPLNDGVIEYMLDNYYKAQFSINETQHKTEDGIGAEKKVADEILEEIDLNKIEQVSKERPVEVIEFARGDVEFEKEITRIKNEEMEAIKATLIVMEPPQINSVINQTRDYLKVLKTDVIRINYGE